MRVAYNGLAIPIQKHLASNAVKVLLFLIVFPKVDCLENNKIIDIPRCTGKIVRHKVYCWRVLVLNNLFQARFSIPSQILNIYQHDVNIYYEYKDYNKYCLSQLISITIDPTLGW